MKDFKRLFIDIEISPCLGWFFRTGKQQINENQIIDHPKIICIAYRWEHDKKGKVLYWDKDQCDKQLIENFSKVAELADIIIGQNSQNFDIRWIVTRLCFHKSLPLRVESAEDTYKQARKNLYLPSYKLNYMARFFGIGAKLSRGWGDLISDVWLCNKNKTLKEMGKYCLQDVDLALEVWKRLYPYVDHKGNYAVLREDREACPHCGENSLQISKRRITRVGKKIQFMCSSCGRYSTLGKNELDKPSEYPR